MPSYTNEIFNFLHVPLNQFTVAKFRRISQFHLILVRLCGSFPMNFLRTSLGILVWLGFAIRIFGEASLLPFSFATLITYQQTNWFIDQSTLVWQRYRHVSMLAGKSSLLSLSVTNELTFRASEIFLRYRFTSYGFVSSHFWQFE